MTPAPAELAPAAVPAGAAGDRQELGPTVHLLRERYARWWLATPCDPPGEEELGPARSLWRRWRTARTTDRLVRDLCRMAREAPGEGEPRDAWQARVKDRVLSFGEAALGWPRSWGESALGEAIAAGADDFVRRGRELERTFDIHLGADALFQALRNVWILNGLQVLLERPVATTPSVFAYSMLYPLTDNFLDDPEVPAHVKRHFNRRLGGRLTGDLPAAKDRREEAVFALVAEIEGEFPRPRYPRVFESLLAIHRAQVESLRQQAEAAPAGPVDLLRVSCEKGGTSVLADGFIAAGDLSRREIDFLFGYGVALQLLDDLQDATTDLAAGHRTLFSVAAERTDRLGGAPLDALTGRLARFTTDVLRSADRFEAPHWDVISGLIRRSSPLLLLQAVADQRELFSPAFVRRLERHFPVRFADLPGLRRRARRRWRRTESRTPPSWEVAQVYSDAAQDG